MKPACWKKGSTFFDPSRSWLRVITCTESPSDCASVSSVGDSVQVITLSQDLEGSKKVDPFFQHAGFKKLQPYLDTNAAMSSGLTVNLPETILYDSQGKEVWRMAGGMDWTGQTARELVAEAK